MIAILYRRIMDWFTFADYEAAKRQARRDVAARYSRGNVALQQGYMLFSEDMEELTAAGDKAVAKLQKTKSP